MSNEANAISNRASLDENYLLLSDLHLGAGLVSHARPWADRWKNAYEEIDQSLVSFLDHYDRHRPGGRPWRLVIAGDFVDFIGMSLPPPDSPLPSGLTAEERAHGLGSASDHAVCKLQAAASMHQPAFAALARFIASGNRLVIVRGNHDVDFHWKRVQRAFVDILHSLGPAHVARNALKRRVLFCPWFFYVKDLLYVEHGHEFDPMCSYGDPLRPTCPRDPRRIRPTPSDVMMRYVARPTPGLSTSIAETGSVGEYLRLAASLGPLGAVKLVLRFVRATGRLLAEAVLHQRTRAALQRGRLRRLERYVRRFQIGHQVHEALMALYTTPALSQPLALARRLYLDSVCMFALAGLALLAALTLPLGTLYSALSALGGVALLALAARTADRSDDAGTFQERGAARIAQVVAARYIVMGHSHGPKSVPLGRGQTYVNLGNWGQDDLPEDRPDNLRAPCTHLCIVDEGRGYEHALRRWDLQRGPVPFGGERPLPQTQELPPALEPLARPARAVAASSVAAAAWSKAARVITR